MTSSRCSERLRDVPKVTWAPEAVQASWSPPSPSLGSMPGPLPRGELVLRIPMQGSSLQHPSSKRLRAAGKSGLRILMEPEFTGSGLHSAQLSTSRSVSKLPSRGPLIPREGTLAARWHCDPAEQQLPAESGLEKGPPLPLQDSWCQQRHLRGLPKGLTGLSQLP